MCSSDLNADILIQLLPVYDNLKLALKHAGKRSDWVIGVEHVANQFRKVLEENGVEEIETVGQEFDPEIHEAVKSHNTENYQQAAESERDNIIKKEIRAGYKLNGKVIFPAKVIV